MALKAFKPSKRTRNASRQLAMAEASLQKAVDRAKERKELMHKAGLHPDQLTARTVASLPKG